MLEVRKNRYVTGNDHGHEVCISIDVIASWSLDDRRNSLLVLVKSVGVFIFWCGVDATSNQWR